MDIASLSITVLTVLLGAIVVSIVGIVLGLLYKGIDRKLAAHMQGRIGPPIRQPFFDIRKLLVKENVIPENAIEWIFNLVPILGLGATISILLFLPIGGLPAILDGFVSADAAYEGGEIITKSLVFSGSELHLNINTSAIGSAAVGILDANGTVFPGYDVPDCDVIRGNFIDKTVTWRDNSDLRKFAGKPVKLRILMRGGKLYSLQFK